MQGGGGWGSGGTRGTEEWHFSAVFISGLRGSQGASSSETGPHSTTDHKRLPLIHFSQPESGASDPAVRCLVATWASWWSSAFNGAPKLATPAATGFDCVQLNGNWHLFLSHLRPYLIMLMSGQTAQILNDSQEVNIDWNCMGIHDLWREGDWGCLKGNTVCVWGGGLSYRLIAHRDVVFLKTAESLAGNNHPSSTSAVPPQRPWRWILCVFNSSSL